MTRTNDEPAIPATLWMRAAQTLLPPTSLVANSREPTASEANTETVMAVPMAMAKVANTPAQKMPMPRAKIRTPIAPVHGLIPIDRARDHALAQDHWPSSCAGVAMWACPQQEPSAACTWSS